MCGCVRGSLGKIHDSDDGDGSDKDKGVGSVFLVSLSPKGYCESVVWWFMVESR